MTNRLLTGTAIAAALAFAGPVWAQTTTTTTPSPTGTPSSAYQSGMPSTSATPQTAPGNPYSSSQQPAKFGQQAPSGQQMPQTTAGRTPEATAGRTPEATAGSAMEAMPRRHHATRGHAARHNVAHRTTATKRSGGQMRDNIADQLNREEASRIQSGSSMPPQNAPAPQQMPQR